MLKHTQVPGSNALSPYCQHSIHIIGYIRAIGGVFIFAGYWQEGKEKYFLGEVLKVRCQDPF